MSLAATKPLLALKCSTWTFLISCFYGALLFCHIQLTRGTPARTWMLSLDFIFVNMLPRCSSALACLTHRTRLVLVCLGLMKGVSFSNVISGHPHVTSFFKTSGSRLSLLGNHFNTTLTNTARKKDTELGRKCYVRFLQKLERYYV